MKFGIFIFATDKAMPIVEVARAAEERGFESLWVPEHVHIPVKRQTPFPLSEDGSLPERYLRAHDPLVALAAAAGATSTIKLGTAVCLVTEHEPIALAKAVASLDDISGGRLLFGVGAGWLREEMEPLGTRFETRWQVTEQRVAAMKRMWTEEEPEYQSEFVNVPRTFVYPKAAQSPHPPVYIGAASCWCRQRVAEWADGWLPTAADPDWLAHGVADLRKRTEAAGRDPDAVGTSLLMADAGLIAAYERAGIERCIFEVPSGPRAAVLPELDRLAKVVAGRTGG